MTIRALVVDDEAPARKRLRDLIATEGGIELVGECEDGGSAVEAILSLEPDVVFLDVQMPEVDGFDVIEAVGLESLPAVVFVTAYDQHALAAFDARAVDYLLKPFTRERFRETLARLSDARGAERSGPNLGRILADRPRSADRIAIREAGRIRFVRTVEIEWIEGDGNYVRLHLGSREHRARGTVKEFAARLAAYRFARIHQSYVVNLERVRELRPWSHGELVVVLDSGKELVSSRTYSSDLRGLLHV